MMFKLRQKHVKQSWNIVRKAAPMIFVAAEAAFPASKAVRNVLKVGKLFF